MLSLTIAHISDCHLFADQQQVGYGQINPYLSLHSVFAQITAQQVDVVIASGDISGDASGQSYRHFHQLWQQSGCQAHLIVLPGNHDNEELLADVVSNQRTWPSPQFRAHNWQVHGLNSKTSDTQGTIHAEQLDIMAQRLAEYPDSHHLLAVHHHPIACGGWMDAHSWLNRDLFMEFVARHPQIKMVLYGHIHHASEHQRQHCRFMSVPSTCWQWANQADFGLSDEQPGFRLLALHPNGQFASQVKWINRI